MISLSSFEQFDVVMPKKRLTSFGLAVTQERWEVFRAWSGLSREGYLMHFPGDLTTMMLETSWSAVSQIRFLFHFRKSPKNVNFFYDATSLQPMIEFLSCIHLHSEGEDLNEISKTKSIRMVPTLCGMSSTDKYCSISCDVRKPRIIQPSSRTS